MCGWKKNTTDGDSQMISEQTKFALHNQDCIDPYIDFKCRMCKNIASGSELGFISQTFIQAH